MLQSGRAKSEVSAQSYTSNEGKKLSTEVSSRRPQGEVRRGGGQIGSSAQPSPAFADLLPRQQTEMSLAEVLQSSRPERREERTETVMEEGGRSRQPAVLFAEAVERVARRGRGGGEGDREEVARRRPRRLQVQLLLQWRRSPPLLLGSGAGMREFESGREEVGEGHGGGGEVMEVRVMLVKMRWSSGRGTSGSVCWLFRRRKKERRRRMRRERERQSFRERE